MNRQQQLQTIVNQVLQRAGKTIVVELTPEMRLQQELGLDSLELAELTVLLDAEFGVDVFADGVVRTVGEVLEKLAVAKE